VTLREPLTFRFADDGEIPNNAALPMLFYKSGVDLAGHVDTAGRMEAVFTANGWGRGLWRNGVFDYPHYHSMTHELLGVARGRAKLRFGGSKGEIVDVKPGDVVVLPAGTGHQRIEASGDFLVIGAYPPDGKYDLCRGGKAFHRAALETIPQVPVPDSDPLFGAGGPLTKLWRATGGAA
jgi:uncharacterized protein YjlB